MFTVSWRVTRDRSTEIMERTRNRIDAELELGAQRILAKAKADVHVRSGDTRDSGQVVKFAPMDWRVTFGEAAIYLEFGTAHHQAYPFLIPAGESERAQILQSVARIVGGRPRADYLHQAPAIAKAA